MDEPPNDEPRLRKTSPTLWLLALLLLLTVAMVGFSLFGPNPPIEIGPATTRITTPLDANGLPDYAAVLLADSRKGVTPENNGAVPFLKAMWPEEEYSPEEAKLICEELGLPGVPPIEGRVTSLYSDKVRLGALRLLRERLPKPEGSSQTKVDALDPTDESLWGMMDASGGMSYEAFLTGPPADAMKDSRVHEMINLCQPVGQPWTAEDLPFLAEWLEENNTALDRLVEAAERPEWHSPPPGLLQCGSGILAEASHFGSMSELRDSVRFLATRSHFHQGNGNYNEATRDAMAIARLASHSKNGQLIADHLTAVAFGGVGLEVFNQIVTDKAIPVATLRTLLAEFDQIGSFSRFAHLADQGERFWSLDAIVDLQKFNDYSAVAPDSFSSFNWISCDWNLTLKAINAHYDAIVAASKLPTWAQRQAAYEQIDATAEAVSFPPSTTSELLGLLTARGRGKMVGSLWVNLLGGNVAAFYRVENRVITERQLTRLSIALAIHRAEQGAYPESLEELIPGILPKLPVDLFHKNPFAYRKTDDGYLLYSLGPNGTDEGASNHGQSSPPKLEGVMVELPSDYYDESVRDENGEYVGESAMSANRETETPYSKIPIEADDLSLRVPLPEPEPWPWERNN